MSGGRKESIVLLDPSFAGSKGMFLHPSPFFFVDFGGIGILWSSKN